MNINLSDVPNKERWISIATQVANNPDDFKLWEELIQITEFLPSLNLKTKYKINSQSTNIEKQLVLIVYENLLIQFPLLEQYWINYSNWFYKFNNLSKAIDTFERALIILPNSLIIWNSYIDLQLKLNSDNDKMIINFERAREAIGYHYLANSFFDKYLYFLKNINYIKHYHILLRKIIEIPQYDYLKYYKEFLKLIENANFDTIKYLISLEDLKKDYNLNWDDLFKPEKWKLIKIELKKKFTDLFITTQYHSWKFYNFERKLKTFYYKPNIKLTRLELQTWKSYIEYIEIQNLKIATKEKEINLIKNNSLLIDTIYNRCLIVTASYPYFWIKLSNYYLNYNDLKTAKLILIKGIYLNPIENLKLRIRLIDLFILSTEFDKAKSFLYESLKLLPNNIQLFCKLLEVEHFTQSSNVSKLIINKLTDILKLGNIELENQFDYLFIEMLNFSCISLEKINQIFEKFNTKKSYYYLKAKKMFFEIYKNEKPIIKHIPSGWECEYF
ncbi:hypothetical protein C6P40_000603 [Pichia californica]|uniref:Uncharacterized protein n=1 Tax=Pichia californica TaxID=460514 RepID=A0A9P6WKF5_9ASCO|nr:hypothetical protein C6P42_000688 [[Candida] californica]KAG0688720.1 hypothetical protein C6P40_000603 [[Candida] californica]